jgi:hypothetical protein
MSKEGFPEAPDKEKQNPSVPSPFDSLVAGGSSRNQPFCLRCRNVPFSYLVSLFLKEARTKFFLRKRIQLFPQCRKKDPALGKLIFQRRQIRRNKILLCRPQRRGRIRRKLNLHRMERYNKSINQIKYLARMVDF